MNQYDRRAQRAVLTVLIICFTTLVGAGTGWLINWMIGGGHRGFFVFIAGLLSALVTVAILGGDEPTEDKGE